MAQAVNQQHSGIPEHSDIAQHCPKRSNTSLMPANGRLNYQENQQNYNQIGTTRTHQQWPCPSNFNTTQKINTKKVQT